MVFSFKSFFLVSILILSAAYEVIAQQPGQPGFIERRPGNLPPPNRPNLAPTRPAEKPAEKSVEKPVVEEMKSNGAGAVFSMVSHKDPGLHDLTTHQQRRVYVGVVTDMGPIRDKKLEEQISVDLTALLAGVDKTEFVLTDKDLVEYRREVVDASKGISVLERTSLRIQFYYVYEAEPGRPESKPFPREEQDAIWQKVVANLHEVIVKRRKSVASNLTELAKPALKSSVEVRPDIATTLTPERVPADKVGERIEYFNALMDGIRQRDSQFADRLKKELAATEIHFIPQYAFSKAEAALITDLVRNDSAIKIAKHGFDKLKEKHPKTQAYVVLFALVERMLPRTDGNRGAKALEFVMRVYGFERDKQSLDIPEEDFAKYKMDLAASELTFNLYRRLEDIREFRAATATNLSTFKNDGGAQQTLKDLDFLAEVIQARADDLLSEDYERVFGENGDKAVAPRDSRGDILAIIAKAEKPTTAEGFEAQRRWVETARLAIELAQSGDLTTDDLKKIKQELGAKRKSAAAPMASGPVGSTPQSR